MRLILNSNEQVNVQTEAGNIVITSNNIPDNQGIIVTVEFVNQIPLGTELKVISKIDPYISNHNGILLNVNNRD